VGMFGDHGRRVVKQGAAQRLAAAGLNGGTINPLRGAAYALDQLQGARPIGHPSTAESLIPIWGSGREAVADLQGGDYGGAAVNGALAASDVFMAGSFAKGMAKGGFYGLKELGRVPNYKWPNVRKWMGTNGYLAPGQHGHHWLIPQKEWGKSVPDWIKNQPWNIKPMPSPEVHGRLRGSYKGKPQFNPLEGYWFGTPAWSKVGTADAIGHSVAAAQADDERRR
jgi:hypothetical protein